MKLTFKTLEEAHTYAESIEDGWVAKRNYCHALKELQQVSESREERENIRWEIDCMNFVLDKGEVKSKISITDKEVKVNGYPSCENFNESTYSYIVGRLQTASNPLLKARFNQILWNSPIKNATYAKLAIDAHIEVLKQSNDVSKIDRDNCNTFFNAMYLASTVNYKFEDVLKLADDDVVFCQADRMRIYAGLLDVKKVKPKHLDEAQELCDSVIASKQKEGNQSDVEWSLKIAIKLANRCSKDKNLYMRQLAECYESSAEDRMSDDSMMIPIHFLSQALEIYQDLKDEAKSEEVSLKIVELRKDFKLGSVRTELSEDETKRILDYFNAKADKYLERDIDEFFDLLTNGSHIFPTIDTLKKMADRQERSFMDVISKSFVDINNNQSKGAEDDDEKATQKLYEEYGMFISMEAGLFMDILFRKAIASGQLSYQTLINQFHKRTWLGNNYEERSGGGELRKYNWLSLIAPSLFEFFRQEEANILGHKYRPNHILVIDSLTLKFEGVLRDFARLIGVQTIRYSKKGRGEREMYIEDLLGNDKLQEYFDENDRMLFKYLFLSEGLNLRNNVSHCFLRYDDYKNIHIYLLIAAFLRIGKYYANTESGK